MFGAKCVVNVGDMNFVCVGDSLFVCLGDSFRRLVLGDCLGDFPCLFYRLLPFRHGKPKRNREPRQVHATTCHGREWLDHVADVGEKPIHINSKI